MVPMVTSAKGGMSCNLGNPTIPNNQKPLLRKAHLRNSNHFKTVETMRLRIIASRSP
jgi:hypothetical protein